MKKLYYMSKIRLESPSGVLQFTCIADLPDRHVHGVGDVDVSPIVHREALGMVHPRLPQLPINMPGVPL